MKQLNFEELAQELEQFCGSGNMYAHELYGKKLLFTEGVKYLADAAECYWLITAIFSHQINKRVRQEEFQVWELKRKKGDAFLLTADDGNGNIIALQRIPFSDFPLNYIKLHYEYNTLMLPQER